MDESPQKYDRVGGWLILFCLGLIATISKSIKYFLTEAENPIVLGFDLINYVTILIFAIFLLVVLYYKRKRYAPKLAIIYCWTAVALNLLSSLYFIVSNNHDIGAFLAKVLPALLIYVAITTAWTLYFLRSERVKKTFVN